MLSRKIYSILAGLLTLSILLGAINISPAAAKPPMRKNVIVMISDGMGFNHTRSASYYEAGAEARQVYAKFPFRYAMSTYPGSDAMGAPTGDRCFGWGYDPARAWSEFDYVRTCPTDSAAAATAMASGVKSFNAGVGVDIYGNPVQNIVEYAEERGRSTGVITTVEFSHATPAGFVAHNISRNNYEAIAQEMILQSKVDVIMGVGHPWFDDNGMPRVTPNNYRYVGGVSTWDQLVAGTAGGDANGDGAADPWTLIESRDEFQSLASGPTPSRVMGVAQAYTTLQQARSGDANADPYVVPQTATVPTLVEMTNAALNVLDNDPDGFFLMIEGGAVDWAAHANQSGRMIEEQIDFDLAVKAVTDWVQANSNWGETLLIVTGDHETGYLTGPGSNPAWEPIANNGAGVLPGMQWNSGDHTNSLIPFYAKGKFGNLLGKYANLVDPVVGLYLDNTEFFEVMKLMLR